MTTELNRDKILKRNTEQKKTNPTANKRKIKPKTEPRVICNNGSLVCTYHSGNVNVHHIAHHRNNNAANAQCTAVVCKTAQNS